MYNVYIMFMFLQCLCLHYVYITFVMFINAFFVTYFLADLKHSLIGPRNWKLTLKQKEMQKLFFTSL